MMNYELFKEVVAEKILSYMSPEFQNSRVDIRSVEKVNQKLDGLNIIPNDETGARVSPTIYVNKMYEHYKECNDLEAVLYDAAVSIEQGFEQAPDSQRILDFEQAKDNIIMQLVNTEQNREMLDRLPHREFQDLSLIYRWLVDKNGEGIASSMVNYDLAERLGMTETDLFKAAVENTKRILPPTIKSMNDVIREMFTRDGMPAEIADMMIGDMPDERSMYVISNERGINGAASMLYEEGLQKLAQKLGSDLYIMPSSIHEVIVVSTNMGDPNSLAQMVAEINMDQVSLDERLSNQVYHYDKDLRKLSLATDTPNKRLDGIVAEPGLIYENRNKSR